MHAHDFSPRTGANHLQLKHGYALLELLLSLSLLLLSTGAALQLIWKGSAAISRAHDTLRHYRESAREATLAGRSSNCRPVSASLPPLLECRAPGTRIENMPVVYLP